MNSWEIWESVIIPFLAAAVIGLPLGLLVVMLARKHDWFAEKYLITRRQYDQLFEQAFAGRPALTPHQFYQRYFSATAIPEHTVVAFRKVLEEQLDANFSRLVDTDDFTGNLSFMWKWWDPDDQRELVMAIGEEFSMELTDSDCERMKTVREILEIIWSKQNRSTPNEVPEDTARNLATMTPGVRPRRNDLHTTPRIHTVYI